MVSRNVRSFSRPGRSPPAPAAIGFQAKTGTSGNRIASRVAIVGSIETPNIGSTSTKITAQEPVSLFSPTNRANTGMEGDSPTASM